MPADEIAAELTDAAGLVRNLSAALTAVIALDIERTRFSTYSPLADRLERLARAVAELAPKEG